MAQQRQTQFTVSQYPGLGNLAKARKRQVEADEKRAAEQAEREAQRRANLPKARAPQVEIALTWLKSLSHPVSIEVFKAALDAFLTAEAVDVDGKHYGAIAVAVESVAGEDTSTGKYFAEGSKVLKQAIKGADKAKEALHGASRELAEIKKAEQAAREAEKVSA